jgi:hypothetical protein
MRRRIEREATPTGTIDTAVFSGPQSNYTITRNADGSVAVSDGGGAGPDGTDTLTGIERLRFGGIAGTDVSVAAVAPPAPSGGAGPTPPAAGPVTAAAPSAPSAKAVTAAGQATAPRPALAPLTVRSLRVTSSSSAPIAVAASVPAGARTVAITVSRMTSAAKRHPSSVRIGTVYRKTTTAKRYVFRLTDKPFRNLKPGRYLVQVRVGTSRTALGPATSRQVTVKRTRSETAR